MTKAEEKAIAYQLATHGPNVIGGDAVLSDEEHKYWNINYDFLNGYEGAKKETIERALVWLEENVWGHTGLDYTELSDAFRQAMGQEPKNYKVSVKDMIEVSGWRSAKDEKPNPSEWVVVCVKDHGVPQCLALATYNEQLDRWFTDNFEDGEPEEYLPDYWLRIPNFK